MVAPAAWQEADYTATAEAMTAFTSAHPEVLLVSPRARLKQPPAFTGDPTNPARIAGWELRYDEVTPLTFGDDPPYRKGRIVLSAWIEPHEGGTEEAGRELLAWLLAPFVGLSKVGSLTLFDVTPLADRLIEGWHVATQRLDFVGA